jgi:hypothetical protein
LAHAKEPEHDVDREGFFCQKTVSMEKHLGVEKVDEVVSSASRDLLYN